MIDDLFRVIAPGVLDPKGWIALSNIRPSGDNDLWKLVDFNDHHPKSFAVMKRDGTDLYLLSPSILHRADTSKFLLRGVLSLTMDDFPAWQRALVYIRETKFAKLRETIAAPCAHPMVTGDFSGIKRSKGGAPEKYDWDWYREKFEKHVAVNGLPGPLKEYQDADGKFLPWSRQAHAEKWLLTLGVATGDDISLSSAKIKIKQWLETLRKGS